MDLQRTRCAACGYDLQGLPDRGNCPECGRSYHRRKGENVVFGETVRQALPNDLPAWWWMAVPVLALAGLVALIALVVYWA